ncbi:hypothetical protein As57867_005085, partial [Aphanomyces stellatus]
MKRLLQDKRFNMEYVQTMMDEIRLCASLSHPNIVDFIGVTWTKLVNLSLLMEYMALGDVWTLLEEDRAEQLLQWNVSPTCYFTLDDTDGLDSPRLSQDSTVPILPMHREACKLSKLTILRDVVDAVAYLHALTAPVIHRDIKAKNVLLNHAFDAKLTDFGTSRQRVLDYTMTSEIGTVPWTAPEVLKGVRYTEKADIYSIGVFISELDTAEIPYAALTSTASSEGGQLIKNRIMMRVVAGELRPHVTQSCPEMLYEITRRCVAYDPADRPSARELLRWLDLVEAIIQTRNQQFPYGRRVIWHLGCFGILSTAPTPSPMVASLRRRILVAALLVPAISSTTPSPAVSSLEDLFDTTVWGNVTGLSYAVNTTTFTTEGCTNVRFDNPPGWFACREPFKPTCIWYSNGSVARGSDCRATNLYDNKDSGWVSALRYFPPFDIDVVEMLPPVVSSIVIDNAGVKRLHPNLKAMQDGTPVQATLLYTFLLMLMTTIHACRQMINNLITSIDDVQFPDKLQALDLSSNYIAAVGKFQAPALSSLNLSGNLLTTLDKTTFPDGLQELHLSNNPIQHFRGVGWPKILRILGINGAKRPPANPNCPSRRPSNSSSNATKLYRTNMPARLFTPTLDGIEYPLTIEHLSLANLGLTELTAKFPPTLKTVLAGNDITAFYATESQFALLSNLSKTQSNITQTTCCGMACATLFLSTTRTNETCKGHRSTKFLFDTFPICIIDEPQHSSNVVLWVVVVLVLVAGLAFLGLLRRKRDQERQKWYNLNSTDDNTSEMHATLDDDIRFDDAIVKAYRVPADAITQGPELGRGGFGVVFLARIDYKDATGANATRQVAMKRLLQDKRFNMEYVQTMMDEIRLCASLSHPNIVDFIGVTWTKLVNLSLLMEYMALGDVWTLLEEDRAEQLLQWNVSPTCYFTLDDTDGLDSPRLSQDSTVPILPMHREACKLSKLTILRDVVDAVAYLHALTAPVIHRDIKAKNVLLNHAFDAKLTDFGTSRQRVLDYTMTSEIGTVPWTAPEVLKGVRYTEKADIYSIGVFISELDTAEIPYAALT